MMLTTLLFTKLRQRAKSLGSSLLALSIAGGSLTLTSCTTEEGVVAGALAGAALGGVIGHSSERNRSHRRGYNNNYDRYDRGYYQEPRYRRSSNYIPTGYGYSNRGYSNRGYSNRGYSSGGYFSRGGRDCYDYY